jgi:type IV pilus assembly protein PilB
MAAKDASLCSASQVLVIEKKLSKEQALTYQKEAKRNSISLIQHLIDENIIKAIDMALMLSKAFGVPLLDIEALHRDAMPEQSVSESLIRKHSLLPLFKRGDTLFTAIADPSNHKALKDVQFHTGLNVQPVVCECDKLAHIIDEILQEKESAALSDYLDDSTDLDSLEISSEEIADDDSTEASKDDAPVVRFVHKIILDAVKRGASDIHFEPYEKYYRIRFRQDGILVDIANPPVTLANRITARLKIMSSLDISERRIPQDGRFKMRISRSRSIDFRVSTCPTVNGEKVVLRILDPSATKLGIDALGMDKRQKDHFTKIIAEPQGMILVTGPTGSGKTVTLYTALNMLNNDTRNISTAEDPVEIKVKGINQVNIHPKAGLTFANALRSFLRQDPDIIMVGEIRDLETAEIGIKAAQTGHMVLSTLHTNSAAETLTRLANMGVPAFNIAGSVSLIIAQRLCRRLCEHCKETLDDLPKPALLELGFSEEEINNSKFYKPAGCNNCSQGYKGRVGLFEVMPVTKAIGRLIMQGGNALQIEEQAIKEGMETIRRSGLNKVIRGITSIEEISRVTKD